MEMDLFSWGMLGLCLLFVLGIAAGVLVCFVKNKTGKVLLSVFSFISIIIVSGLVLTVFLFFSFGFRYVWLPTVVFVMIFTAIMYLAWKPVRVKKHYIVTTSIIAAALVLVAVSITPEIYWRSMDVYKGDFINFNAYAPFGNHYDGYDGRYLYAETLATALDEESTLKMFDDLPRLDGSESLYPLYSAFVRATYPAPQPGSDAWEYKPNLSLNDIRTIDNPPLVISARYSRAFENLIEGHADIIFLMNVTDRQREAAEEEGLELILTPIGREALVFFVNSRNPVDDLSADDIRRIYSGEVTNWREVGGRNSDIRPFQQHYTSDSQVMFRRTMDGIRIISPLTHNSAGFMEATEEDVDYRNYRNSLGFTIRFYIEDIVEKYDIKPVSIDGVTPKLENAASGAYPYVYDFYAVTVRRDGEYLNPERTDNIDSFIDWILSTQGQYLVEATGYVPVN